MGRDRQAWALLRLTVAGIIAAHGWTRWLTGGVPLFGAFLDAQGLPAGPMLAAAVTALELIGSPLLAANRFVPALCAAYTAVYITGIALVHAKAGWFVVGHGRNGAEFSVLLISCLLALALHRSQSPDPCARALDEPGVTDP